MVSNTLAIDLNDSSLRTNLKKIIKNNLEQKLENQSGGFHQIWIFI